MKAKWHVTAEQLQQAREDPFNPDVLGEESIVCLECGRLLQSLNGHIHQRHHMDADEYREAWGYARTQPLMAKRLEERHAENGRRLDLIRHMGARVPNPGGRIGPTRPQVRPVRQAAVQKAAAKLRGRSGALQRPEVTVEAVLEGRARGLTQRELAEAFRCNVQLIQARLRQAGTEPTRVHPRTRRAFGPAMLDKLQATLPGIFNAYDLPTLHVTIHPAWACGGGQAQASGMTS